MNLKSLLTVGGVCPLPSDFCLCFGLFGEAVTQDVEGVVYFSKACLFRFQPAHQNVLGQETVNWT